jgi:hypothetical protein
MPHIVPSQIVSAIDRFYPWAAVNQAGRPTGYDQLKQFAVIVQLIGQLPDGILVVEPADYLLFTIAVEVIREQASIWHLRGNTGTTLRNIPGHGNLHPIHVVRSVLAKCPDEMPSPETQELRFIEDDALRGSIWQDVASTNRALSNLEWKAATVLAGSAIEALLLWGLNQTAEEEKNGAIEASLQEGELGAAPPAELERWSLHQYISVSRRIGLISQDTATIAQRVKDFRNLIHPGRAQRLAQVCDRGTALTAVGGLECVLRDLTGRFG